MIRPASEIQYPPSEALCFKARMLAKMEDLSTSSEGIMSEMELRLDFENMQYYEEMQAFSVQQNKLLENMRRIISEK